MLKSSQVSNAVIPCLESKQFICQYCSHDGKLLAVIMALILSQYSLYASVAVLFCSQMSSYPKYCTVKIDRIIIDHKL